MEDEYIRTKEEARAIANKLSEESGEYKEINGVKCFIDREEYWMDAMPFYCDTPQEDGSVCKVVIGDLPDLFCHHDICCAVCFPTDDRFHE